MAWPLSDKEVLRRSYGKIPMTHLALALGRSPEAIKQMAKRLGLCESRVEKMECRVVGDDLHVPLHSRKFPGMWTVVSVRHAGRVSQFRWSPVQVIPGQFYARARVDGKLVLMHNFLIDVPDGFEVDHKDRDKLNNRDENLRLATRAQNLANRDWSDGYKGVSRSGKRWAARQGAVRLGSYDTPEEAARAYDAKALEQYGEFALLNFPLG